MASLFVLMWFVFYYAWVDCFGGFVCCVVLFALCLFFYWWVLVVFGLVFGCVFVGLLIAVILCVMLVVVCCGLLDYVCGFNSGLIDLLFWVIVIINCFDWSLQCFGDFGWLSWFCLLLVLFVNLVVSLFTCDLLCLCVGVWFGRCCFV